MLYDSDKSAVLKETGFRIVNLGCLISSSLSFSTLDRMQLFLNLIEKVLFCFYIEVLHFTPLLMPSLLVSLISDIIL